MKHRYRLFRRGWGTYYCEDRQTGKQETLRTRDKAEAYRLVAARNETEQQPAFSLHLARVYWKAGDPAAASRTWQHVIDEVLKLKSGNTLIRWRTASQDKALDPLRPLVLLETHSHHLLRVLEKGSVSTNLYLRRLHNFALDMSWLPWPVLPRKNWPVIRFKEKRAVTREEHEAIVAREPNPEWRAFYELLWATGGSQSDVASLTAEHVDRESRILSYLKRLTAHINHRLLEVERASQNCRFSQQSMQRLIEPTLTPDGQKAPGLKFGQPRVMALLLALCLFLTLPAGFTNRQLRHHVANLLGLDPDQYQPGQMTYDLRRLRLKGFICRRAATHTYEVTPYVRNTSLFLARLYQRVLRPGLAVAVEPPWKHQPPHPLRDKLNAVDAQIQQMLHDAHIDN